MPEYDDELRLASVLFSRLVDPHIVDYLDEEVGLLFHLSVELLEGELALKWREAIQDLSAAVLKKGDRRTFKRLELPPYVRWAKRAGALRLIVQYVPATVSETGVFVPGYDSARFDVAGTSYPA